MYKNIYYKVIKDTHKVIKNTHKVIKCYQVCQRRQVLIITLISISNPRLTLGSRPLASHMNRCVTRSQ